jgi:hypothetical protein
MELQKIILYIIFIVGIYNMNAQHSLIQRNLVYQTKVMGDGSSVGIGHWNEDWFGGHLDSNNTFINNIVYGAHRNFYTDTMIGTIVANNVFVNSTYFASVQLGVDNINSTFVNNIIIQEDSLMPIYVPTNSNIIFSNNLYNKAYDSDAVDSGDIIGNPLFAKTGSISPGQLTGNYFRLVMGSPAINNGTKITKVTDDYFGNARDSKTDIGAIEYI